MSRKDKPIEPIKHDPVSDPEYPRITAYDPDNPPDSPAPDDHEHPED